MMTWEEIDKALQNGEVKGNDGKLLPPMTLDDFLFKFAGMDAEEYEKRKAKGN